MPQNKGERTHRGMYIADTIWMLAWYAGRHTNRTRPDYVAYSVIQQLKRDGILSDTNTIPTRHRNKIIHLLSTNPPDKRNVQDMFKALESREVL